MRSIVITGIDHYYGAAFFYVGQRLKIRKEPDNRFDGEAIEVLGSDGNRCGYVAKSVSTVGRGACSAGRIYDTIGQEHEVIVRFIIKNIVIADLADDEHIHS